MGPLGRHVIHTSAVDRDELPLETRDVSPLWREKSLPTVGETVYVLSVAHRRAGDISSHTLPIRFLYVSLWRGQSLYVLSVAHGQAGGYQLPYVSYTLPIRFHGSTLPRFYVSLVLRFPGSTFPRFLRFHDS